MTTDRIPAELRERPQWVVWKHVQRNGTPTKVPFQVNGREAKSNSPSTWSTFEEAAARFNSGGFEGVGYMFSESDPYVGIDLDGCRDPETGRTRTWAVEWMQKLGSYAEISPSMTGWKIVCIGENPRGKGGNKKLEGAPMGGKNPGVEIYDRGRFFALTGLCHDDYTSLREANGTLWEFVETYWPPRKKRGPTAPTGGTSPVDVIERARRYVAKMAGAVSGQNGHDQTFTVACRLVIGFDLTPHQAYPILAEYNQRCEPAWSENELWHKLESANDKDEPRGELRDSTRPSGANCPAGGTAGRARTRQDAPESTLKLAEGRTELANAGRLVARHGDVIRWCDPWGKWLVWDGKRWNLDDCRRIDSLAAKVVSNLWDEAATASKDADANTVKFMWRFVAASNQANAIRNMVGLARCDVPILPSQLDQHPWLLNCENGTLDLRDGTLRSHDKADHITQLVPVEYHADATCPTWRAFLHSILGGDRDLILYVQRLLGYCLTGSTREHLLPFLHGIGSNGKSVFTNVVLAMLGPDYAIKAGSDLLLTKRDAHPTELCDLYGKRFVACIEAEDGRRLAESLVKELTGSDKIRARRMREDFWEFSATHKVLLAANHRPTVRGSDHGLWRRLKLLPFTRIFWDADKGESGPDELKMDKDMENKLLAELPGILAWSVEGCRQWLQDGLKEPECVRAATGDYQAEMDLVGRFLTDCCDVDPELSVGATTLFKAFKQWCDDQGERGFNQTRFGARLTERGFDTERTRSGVVRHGLSLVGEL